MIVLGVETSADETAAAVVEDGHRLLSNVVVSSLEMTKRYGGIVPEVAARSHLEVITPVIDHVLRQAKLSLPQINAIAVTKGPGLLGSLLIGVLAARSLALAKNKPIYGVNHVLAHVYASFLTDKATASALKNYQLSSSQPKFPALALIVSGGHTQLVLLRHHFDYQVLGQSRDDAIGEAFDKVARMLGLPQPGGPSISAVAATGNPKAINFPIADVPGSDFSFSGLKTAVLRTAQQKAGQDFTFPSHELSRLLKQSQIADIAASFQYIAVKTVVDKAKKAIEQYQPKSLILAGGVAANALLRQELSCQLPDLPIFLPDIKLCTDNAAMIATLGFYAAISSTTPDDYSSLDVNPSLKIETTPVGPL